MSALPSPLKSRTTTLTGFCPDGYVVAAPKLPPPVPSRTATLLPVVAPRARSTWASALKKPFKMVNALMVVANGEPAAAVNAVAPPSASRSSTWRLVPTA